MATQLYEGMIFVVNTDTGERLSASVLVAISGETVTYTVRPTCGGCQPVTMQDTTTGGARMVVEVMKAMRQVSMPA